MAVVSRENWIILEGGEKGEIAERRYDCWRNAKFHVEISRAMPVNAIRSTWGSTAKGKSIINQGY